MLSPSTIYCNEFIGVSDDPWTQFARLHVIIKLYNSSRVGMVSAGKGLRPSCCTSQFSHDMPTHVQLMLFVWFKPNTAAHPS